MPPQLDRTEILTELRIRPATRSDAGGILEIYNDAIRSTTATFDTTPRTMAEQLSWLEGHDQRHPVLVAEVGNSFAGWAALSPWSDRRAYSGTAEVSVYVGAQWRGKGVGRLLMTETLAAARRCGLHTVLARIAEGNPVSRRLHTSAGFRSVGVMHEVGLKFGKFLDVELLERRIPGSASGTSRTPNGSS